MKRRVVFIFLFAVTLCVWSFALLRANTYYPIDDVSTTKLVGNCELDIYNPPAELSKTVVLACPRMDMIRLWPWPIIHPWFEKDNPCDVWKPCEDG